jgi:type III secretion protein C
MTRLAALLSLVLLCLLATAPVQAADLPPRGRPVRLEASEKPLPDFLRELAASQGVTAVIDPKIGGVISGKFVLAGTESARNVLNSVCSGNGLTWYYDGAFLYIDVASDARSEVLSISPNNAQRITETLNRLKIADHRFPLSVSATEGSVFVSGPRRYVEMVRQTVRLVDQRTALADSAEIRVFPLKYAWAADFKVHRSGGQVSIPGVTSVLRSLFGKGSGVGGGARGGSSSGMPFTLGANRQIKLSTGDTVDTPKLEMTGPAGAEQSEYGSFNQGELPQFHADTRMNAVLVRDMPDRMARYEKLVAAMDTKPRLVEIEVTIMDVSTDSLNNLGVDWRAHGRRADFQTGQGDRPPLTWGNATTESGQVAGYGNNNNPLTPLGALLTAAIGHETRNYLLARVYALAQKGDANLVARPKVMTLDNSEALLENRNEFYVRVNGFQDSSLYKVNTGTAVRVTPLIVDESSGRGVMMSIDIEDGDIAPGSVDQIPIVRRRGVNTQALVNEGTSLLIAGYTTEERSKVTSGVPLLSSIPLLGKLFQFTEKKQLNMERFYLLTPRLVLPTGAPAASASSPAAGF